MRGGKREGAGAKPKGAEKRVQKNINMTPTAWAILDRLRLPGETANDAMERLVLAHKERCMETTPRGFARLDFTDRYGQACSIQKSSLATEDAIWLGCDAGLHVDGQCCARMHLTQEMVKELLPLPHRFVETGELA